MDRRNWAAIGITAAGAMLSIACAQIVALAGAVSLPNGFAASLGGALVARFGIEAVFALQALWALGYCAVGRVLASPAPVDLDVLRRLNIAGGVLLGVGLAPLAVPTVLFPVSLSYRPRPVSGAAAAPAARPPRAGGLSIMRHRPATGTKSGFEAIPYPYPGGYVSALSVKPSAIRSLPSYPYPFTTLAC